MLMLYSSFTAELSITFSRVLVVVSLILLVIFMFGFSLSFFSKAVDVVFLWCHSLKLAV